MTDHSAPAAPVDMPAVATQPVVLLDLLRGLAAFEVLLAHAKGASFVDFSSLPAPQRTPLVALLFGGLHLSHEAVLFFFALSGFLVGGQIVSKLQNRTFDPTHYAIDRGSRIFLPLVPACLLTAMVNMLFFGESVGLLDLIGNMTGLNGIVVDTLHHNVPLWSLAYEIWFYIIGGTIAYILSRGRTPTIISFLALLTCGLAFTILSTRYLLYWMIAAFASLYTSSRAKNQFFTPGVMVTLAGVTLYQLALKNNVFTSQEFVPSELSETLIIIGISLGLPTFCSRSANQRVHALRGFAKSISGFSYTLYLTHYPTITVLDLYLPQAREISLLSIGEFMLRCAASILVAVVLYYAFERNTETVRRYLKSKLRKGMRAGKPAPLLPAG